MLLYVPLGFKIQSHFFTSIELTCRVQVRIPGVLTNSYIVTLLSLDELGEARQILVGWITASGRSTEHVPSTIRTISTMTLQAYPEMFFVRSCSCNAQRRIISLSCA